MGHLSIGGGHLRGNRLFTFALCCSSLIGYACSDSDSARGSPTGTTLQPRTGIAADGYVVVDEVCGDINDSSYWKRFETPMFRAVVVVDEIAYLLDGSLLWAVNIANPATPERVSLTRLPGHPVSLSKGDAMTLWVAAGEAGLLAVNITDPAAPAVSSETDFGKNVLDVEWLGGRGYVALGSEGLASFALDELGTPVLKDPLAVNDFVADLAVTEDSLYVAACDRVLAYALVPGAPPSLLSTRSVPSSHGRRVTATEDAVYVSAGEALYAYGIRDDHQLRALGSYSDPENPLFYVNHFVALGDKGFIAAGDESVRVIDLSEIAQWRTSYTEDAPLTQAELDAPVDAAIPTVQVWSGDPIAVGLHGTALLVLGNFRWVGQRLLTILDATVPEELPELGRYAQPELYSSVKAGDNEVWLQDPKGRKMQVNQDLQIVGEWGYPNAQNWSSVGDILVYSTDDGRLFCSSGYGAIASGRTANDGGWVVVGSRLVAGDSVDNKLVSYSIDGQCEALETSDFTEGLGLIGHARLGTSQGRLLAYDRVLGILRVFQDALGSGTAEPRSYDVGLCENYDWADVFSGANEHKTQFVATPDGFALLCPSDEAQGASLRPFTWNKAGEPLAGAALALPAGNYTSALATSQGWALSAFSNGRYESELLLLDTQGQVAVRHTYSGHAKGLAELNANLMVFDNDVGALKYDPISDALVSVQVTDPSNGGAL